MALGVAPREAARAARAPESDSGTRALTTRFTQRRMGIDMGDSRCPTFSAWPWPAGALPRHPTRYP